MINELSSPQVNSSGQTTKMSLTLHIHSPHSVTDDFCVNKEKKKRDETREQRMLTRTELTVHCRILCETVTACIHWQRSSMEFFQTATRASS